MKNRYPIFALLGILFLTTGCATVDRFAGTLDMTVGRLGQPGKHEFEGVLVAARPFGAMTAMQFENGHVYDVDFTSPGLQRGDIVRLYKTEKGYTARLWKRS